MNERQKKNPSITQRKANNKLVKAGTTVTAAAAAAAAGKQSKNTENKTENATPPNVRCESAKLSFIVPGPPLETDGQQREERERGSGRERARKMRVSPDAPHTTC